MSAQPAEPLDPCEKCPRCHMRMVVTFDHIAGCVYMRCFWCHPGSAR